MSNEKSILIGSTLLWSGAYSSSKTYYKKNIVTCYTCVFVCKSNGVIGASPITVAQNGTISLSDSAAWECILDNTDLYNATLSTNNLETRIGNVELSVASAVNTADAAAIDAANAVSSFNKLKTVTESQYAELVENDNVDESSYYFIISDSDAE